MRSPFLSKKPKTEMVEATSWKDGVAGACAGAVSRTLLAPVERIKLVQQLELGSLPAHQVAWKIYTDEGFVAFWRGNLPSCLRVAGTAAINFTCMSYYKQIAHQSIRMENERLKKNLISLLLLPMRQRSLFINQWTRGLIICSRRKTGPEY